MNYYDFSGGMVNRKSPYLMKTDQVPQISNFDIEEGGLTVRAGTKKLYGPFKGAVKAIHKALSTKGDEMLFVQSDTCVEMVLNGVICNHILETKYFRVLNITDGFGFLIGTGPRLMNPLYCRADGEVSIEKPGAYYFFLDQLEDDYTTDGAFPKDLYGCNIVDSQTGNLYYGVAHTEATPENIHALLQTNAFYKPGAIGDLLTITCSTNQGVLINLKSTYFNHPNINLDPTVFLSNLFSEVTQYSGVALQAFGCPYLVWHPASMRYFAAGNPDHPTALYISEPNDWCSFSESNVLYPHLHLGKITGLNIVEKSVVVSYEYGWSHYVGSDPTDDGQWSLLSVPDGTKYGETSCLTPGSVTFLSEGELMSFSASMLTVQMLYSPSSSLYKFLTKEKIKLPKPTRQAFAYYKDGNYYLIIDDKMYVYHYFLSAFTCYDGLGCNCIAEDYSGRLLLGNKNYITTFSKECSFDYDPKTDSNHPISYEVTIPALGVVKENEVARCQEVVVKTRRLSQGGDCTVSLASEKESCEGKLIFSNQLQYGITDWQKHYQDSIFSETVFPWKVSGNIFFLQIEGTTNPKETSPVCILNVYLDMKKERNKL